MKALIIQFMTMCVLLIVYYKFIKQLLIQLAGHAADAITITRLPRNDVKGVLELCFIAFSHVIFCCCLLYVVPIEWRLELDHVVSYFIYGMLLGVGCMGTSALLCNILVCCVNERATEKFDLKTWLTFSRGGWIKHHLQSFEILPLYFSIPILLMQVGSEEIIFRAVIFHYFSPFGVVFAIVVSLLLFTVMQAFLMNRWQSSIFPMVGALVMGTAHSILYHDIPVIWPLVVSHVSFFIFSIL